MKGFVGFLKGVREKFENDHFSFVMNLVFVVT